MRRSYRSGEVPRHHRPGPRRDPRRRASPPTSSSASPARPRRTSSRRSTVVRAGAVRGAFTFQYSKRPGTPAATMPDQIDPAVVQDRYQRLVAVADEIAWAENKTQVGRTPRADGRRGRGPQGRRHPPALRPRPRQPARPLHAAARRDGPSRRRGRPSRSPTPRRTTSSPTARPAVRRTRAGDAWERAAPTSGAPRRTPPCGGRPGCPPSARPCRIASVNRLPADTGSVREAVQRPSGRLGKSLRGSAGPARPTASHASARPCRAPRPGSRLG